jgi:tripartite-type tricarboxylate transporter receptor subunit TctC
MQVRSFTGLLRAALIAVAIAPVPIAQAHAQAQVQDWPQRPVRIIVPFAAGGSSDVAGRIVAQRLSDAFGQQFVVENRPGASGVLAAETVARAPADGYTLLMGSTAQISVMPQMQKTAYDPAKDFAPISIVGTNPFVLVVHPSLPVKTVAELVAYARAQPEKLAYASSGVGSIGHLSMELFLKRAGIEMTAVNYKGGTAQLNDVVAGHVKVTFLNLSTVAPFAASGALRLLAVSSEKRAPQVPDVPTLIESGFAGLKILNWVSLMAPAGTPKPIVDRIAAEVTRAVKAPDAVKLLEANGIDPVGSTPEAFAALIATDIPLWAEAVKLAGLQAK